MGRRKAIAKSCPVVEAHTGEPCGLDTVGWKDMCKRHYRRWEYKPDADPGARPLGMGPDGHGYTGPCQIPGCTWVEDSPANDYQKSRFTPRPPYGFVCRGHDSRILYGKTGADLTAPFTGPGWPVLPCAIPGCTWAETTRAVKVPKDKRLFVPPYGWVCHGHYGRDRKGLDMEAPFRKYQPIPDGQTCDVEGCDLLVIREGYKPGQHYEGYGYACSLHSARMQLTKVWGGDVRPTKRQESYTLKRVRAALKVHGAKLVSIPVGDLDYRTRLDVCCLECGEKGNKSIVKVCNDFDQGICRECGGHGYNSSKPGVLYLIRRSGVLKIGITNTKRARLKAHKGYGWEVIRTWSDEDGKVPQGLERQVLHHWRHVLHAPRALTSEDMPQAGFTETASTRKVGLQRTIDYIEGLREKV